MSALPAMSVMWQQVDRAFAGARMDRANLLAAMRAAVSAQADGEPDPFWYARDAIEHAGGARGA